MTAKYNMGLNSWFPNMETNRMVSCLWRDILQIKSRNPLAFNKFMENIRLIVGDGNSLKFWTDPWVNGKCLSSLYPRFFNICLIKDETVATVLSRKEEQLIWEFQLRRGRFLRGEIEDFNSMTLMLDGLRVILQPRSDHLTWIANVDLRALELGLKLVEIFNLVERYADLQIVFELKALQRIRAFRLCAIASSSSRLRSVFKLLGPVAFVSSSFKAPLPLFLWAKAPWLLLLCEFLVTLPGKSSSKVAVVLKLAYTMLRRSLKPATTSKPMLCSNDAAMIGWFLKLSTMLKPIFSFDRRVEANLARKVLP
ncbi:hypothetical protein RHGRI_010610 [Rhododendron griersonianum]|uniref:Uncharacterized protein n=1 Tax=Rhododendron griersonianum TaxID=479676 RepID=A0AAV6KJZ2_9ERIC|nr:hypothetical protein RHGRI_010610 [Rhododendron griersonianum]